MMRKVDPDFQSPSVLTHCLSFAASSRFVAITWISALAARTKALRLSASVTWAAVTGPMAGSASSMGGIGWQAARANPNEAIVAVLTNERRETGWSCMVTFLQLVKQALQCAPA